MDMNIEVYRYVKMHGIRWLSSKTRAIEVEIDMLNYMKLHIPLLT